MKRSVLKLVLFLLAGAIINVAVAWGFTLAHGFASPWPQTDYEKERFWPIFAIWTIFYAAIVWGGWMLFAVPGAVRRRVRIRRGQCASCGYSLRGTPHGEKCPECGKPARHTE